MPGSKHTIAIFLGMIIYFVFFAVTEASAQIIVDSNTVILRFDTNETRQYLEYHRIFKNALPTDGILPSEI